MQLFFQKDHIARFPAPATAFGEIQASVSVPPVIGPDVPEKARGAMNGCDGAFQFEIDADRSLVQFDFQAALFGQGVGGSNLFIPKYGIESQPKQNAGHLARTCKGNFRLIPHLKLPANCRFWTRLATFTA